MADVSKAQKLASARKKFKELKKEKKKNAAQQVSENTESAPSSREQTPVEVVTNVEATGDPAQLHNYFNNGFQQPAAFFDSFGQDNSNSTLFPNNYFHSEAVTNDVEYANIEPSVAVTEGTKNEEIADFHVFDTVKLEQNSQLPNLESVNQFANEMTELINPTSDTTQLSEKSDLEKKNEELTALLSQEKLQSDQLHSVIQELQSRLIQAEDKLRDRQSGIDLQSQDVLSNLTEQLEYYKQAVQILVAEKTELVSNLTQFQQLTKQKTEECEELQGRLKTSRSRVADLEREVANLKNEKNQYGHMEKQQSSELELLSGKHKQLKEERDELAQDLLEVREKLKTSSDSSLVLQQQVAELTNQLSLANVKIQQLTNGDQASGQAEQLIQDKYALEKHISELSAVVKTLTKDRDESSLQYQQYAQQLNSQLSNMAARLEKLQKENESLHIGEQNRIKHIGELEKQLQSIQNEQINFTKQKSDGSKVELEAALELIKKLQTENSDLQEENFKAINEKDILLKDLESRIETVRELDGLVEELKGNQPDNVKLLATMESDKVAAARAVAQNTELKSQMDSMQEVFMKLNNDKIELTESLSIEQRNSRDLFEKLQKTEIHLQTLADAIEIKDRELSHLREHSFQLDKQVLQSEQLADRLRHYEAHDHSSASLQNELQKSQQKIEALTEEIHKLKESSNVEAQKENDTSGEVLELKLKLQETETKNKELENQEVSRIDSNHNDHWNILDKDSAMKHLEAKFMKTMQDIANLTEEKQSLEHLVLQLQGETETIGEYVALYQHQRSLLKQKAIEKDQQLSQLANDREQIKQKLEKLNELIKKLVLEKGSVPVELLEQHESLSKDNQLCEEHAKISSEINKMAQHSLTVETKNGEGHSSETAEQIIALLGEIKSSNLVQPTDNFHHCPWCQGQLITV